MPPKDKAKIVKDVTQLVLARRARMCNFLEYKGAHCFNDGNLITLDAADKKVVYRRYASLFFVCGIGAGDNELVTLEIIHRYVEVLDRYFGNVRLFMWSNVKYHLRPGHRSASLTCRFDETSCIALPR